MTPEVGKGAHRRQGYGGQAGAPSYRTATNLVAGLVFSFPPMPTRVPALHLVGPAEFFLLKT